MDDKDMRYDKLDNTANLFPAIANSDVSNVYRVSVTLKEEINEELLQRALDKVLPFFDVFDSRMSRGIFWYYFEHNTNPAPRVVKEETFPCAYINPYTNGEYLFRVTYYKNRINLEVFHALTDGNGAFAFLKEIAYQYLRYSKQELASVNDTLCCECSLDKEDSYVRNYKKDKIKKYKTKKALIIKGEPFWDGKFGIIHGNINLMDIKKTAKQYGVTINQYLIGVFAWAVYTEYLKKQPCDKPFSACVPVNLRPYFESDTTKNFFAIVSAVFEAKRDDYTFEEVLAEISNGLNNQINKENLEDILSYNVSNQVNKAVRAVPLFLKNFVMKMMYKSSAKANTTTITNLGLINVQDEYKPYIEKFYAVLSLSKGQNIKGAVCSYGDNLVFTFSASVRETFIQRAFFRKLTSDGIHVTIETNGVYYE